jgi:hypothetical protein
MFAKAIQRLPECPMEIAALLGGRRSSRVTYRSSHQASLRSGRRVRPCAAAAGIANADVVTGDGTEGLSEHAPFDAIVMSAAFSEVPPPLVEQLAVAAASCSRSGAAVARRSPYA